MAEVRLEIIADSKNAIREIRSTSVATDKLAKSSSKLAKVSSVDMKRGFADAVQGATGLRVASLGAAGGVALLAGGLAKAVSDTVSLGAGLVDLSDKTGLTIEEIQALRFAAEQTGTSFENVSKGVQTLGRRAAAGLPDAVKGLEQLGLTVDDIVSRDPGAAFELVVERLAEVPNRAEQGAAAMGIFGRTGLEMTGLVNQGLQSNIERFRELDVAMSEGAAREAKVLADAMTDLNAQFTGIKTSVGSVAIPALSNILIFFGDLVPAAVQKSNAVVADFTASFVERQADLAAALALFSDRFVGVSDQLFDSARELREFADGQEEAAQANLVAAATFGQAGSSAKSFSSDVGSAGDELDRAKAKVIDFNRELGSINSRGFFQGIEARAPSFLPDVAVLSDPSRFEGLAPIAPEMERVFGIITEGFVDVESETMSAEEAQQRYNESLQRAADLAQILPGTLGQVVSQSIAAAGAIQNISSAGGLGKVFEAGKGDATGVLGLLGGVGSLAPAIGPLIGIGTAAIDAIAGLFSSGPDLVRDASRDLGATITQELADSIERSGQPLQTAIADIFRAGGFESVDRFAEEIGDVFSSLERGDISKPQAIAALEEAVPLLLANLEELGPAGEAQLERIAAAATPMRFAVAPIPTHWFQAEVAA